MIESNIFAWNSREHIEIVLIDFNFNEVAFFSKD